MSDHPSHDELEALARGTLCADRSKQVVVHLLKSCPACLAKVPALGVLFGIAPLKVQPTPEQEESYADVLRSASDVALSHHRHLQRQRELSKRILALLESGGLAALDELPRRSRGLGLFEALLERSWELRREDPGQMIQLARLATQVAQGLNVRRYGVRRVAEFQCRAWAELGNAYRAADQLDSAQAALGYAQELYEQGGEDKLLGIRLLELQASLAADRRQFGLACNALSLVYEFYHRSGDQHLAGRVLISKGLYTGYAGAGEDAIQMLAAGFSLIDKERDPDLVLAAVHNQLWFLVDCGRLQEARKFLFLNRRYCAVVGGRVNVLKINWLEGRIAAGLGQYSRAEEILHAVKDGLSEAGLPFQSALASLDLAVVLMIQNHASEAQELVVEAAQVFVGLRIEREALGAVLMLKRSFEMRKASPDLVEEVAAFVRRAEYDPNARFDPKPR